MASIKYVCENPDCGHEFSTRRRTLSGLRKRTEADGNIRSAVGNVRIATLSIIPHRRRVALEPSARVRACTHHCPARRRSKSQPPSPRRLSRAFDAENLPLEGFLPGKPGPCLAQVGMRLPAFEGGPWRQWRRVSPRSGRRIRARPGRRLPHRIAERHRRVGLRLAPPSEGPGVLPLDSPPDRPRSRPQPRAQSQPLRNRQPCRTKPNHPARESFRGRSQLKTVHWTVFSRQAGGRCSPHPAASLTTSLNGTARSASGSRPRPRGRACCHWHLRGTVAPVTSEAAEAPE